VENVGGYILGERIFSSTLVYTEVDGFGRWMHLDASGRWIQIESRCRISWDGFSASYVLHHLATCKVR